MSDSFFIRGSLERLLNAARRWGIQPTPFLVTVSVQDQRLYLLRCHAPPQQYALLKDCRISTSRFGIGQQKDSNRTPLGLHRVARKIGGGCMIGTVFWGRKPAAAMVERLDLLRRARRIGRVGCPDRHRGARASG